MAHRDPLMDAAAAILRQHPGIDPGLAYQLAMDADPDLYVHSTPDGSQGAPGGSEAPTGPPATSAPSGPPGVAERYSTMRHYSTLTPGEKREELRKMGAGAAMRPGRTYVQKMAGDAAGGGLFEVVGR